MDDICVVHIGWIKGGTTIQSPFASPMGCRGLFVVSNGYNLCQEVYCKEKKLCLLMFSQESFCT